MIQSMMVLRLLLLCIVLCIIFYVRAEGEATIDISIRCCCQNYKGLDKKQKISVTLWLLRPPAPTNLDKVSFVTPPLGRGTLDWVYVCKNVPTDWVGQSPLPSTEIGCV